MKNRTALIMGGIGGLLPLIITLINIDASTMFKEFDPYVLAGYSVRAIILILLGALFVWVNSETDLKKALQIGIMAPAIALGYMNGADLRDAKKELSVAQQELAANQVNETSNVTPNAGNPAGITGSHIFNITSLAYATNQTQMPKGLHRDPGALSRMWYGLTGRSDNGWFVIVGSHKTENAANAHVERLKSQGYEAIVYPPYRSNPYYGVMIGSWLTLEEANLLKLQAIKDGLPKDTYLWKYRP